MKDRQPLSRREFLEVSSLVFPSIGLLPHDMKNLFFSPETHSEKQGITSLWMSSDIKRKVFIDSSLGTVTFVNGDTVHQDLYNHPHTVIRWNADFIIASDEGLHAVPLDNVTIANHISDTPVRAMEIRNNELYAGGNDGIFRFLPMYFIEGKKECAYKRQELLGITPKAFFWDDSGLLYVLSDDEVVVISPSHRSNSVVLPKKTTDAIIGGCKEPVTGLTVIAVSGGILCTDTETDLIDPNIWMPLRIATPNLRGDGTFQIMDTKEKITAIYPAKDALWIGFYNGRETRLVERGGQNRQMAVPGCVTTITIAGPCLGYGTLEGNIDILPLGHSPPSEQRFFNNG
jgi:hypothetical protein